MDVRIESPPEPPHSGTICQSRCRAENSASRLARVSVLTAPVGLFEFGGLGQVDGQTEGRSGSLPQLFGRLLEKQFMGKKFVLLIAACLAGTAQVTGAEILAAETVRLASACASEQKLAVVSGSEVPALLGTPLRHLALLRYAEAGLSPISFQIDRMDAQGRYLIDDPLSNRAGPPPAAVFDGNDELVFRVKDIGKRLPASSPLVLRNALVAIRITEPASGTAGWIYAAIDSQSPQATPTRFLVRYKPVTDSVESGLYRIVFSNRWPFLVESFYWKLSADRSWSADIIDTMKIRHSGNFLGFIPFHRSHNDYSSRLVAVRQGPLRIIRRTSNRIYMLWKLRTPVIHVDYVMMPDGFVMDIIIDVPFNIGAFFSDVETLTTMDWSDAPELPKLVINAPNGISRLPVDGRMSADKEAFNRSKSRYFSVSSSLGEVSARLAIPDSFPIRHSLYLRDDIEAQDPPENREGQFGNAGFRTTGWERIDKGIHHLKFTVCLKATS